MLAMFTIVQGIKRKIMIASGISRQGGAYLPQSMIDVIESCGFWDSIPLLAVTLIGRLLVWILSFIMIFTVYGRFFKLYIYVAIFPVPMSTFAGEESSHIGKAFFKSFAPACLEGANHCVRLQHLLSVRILTVLGGGGCIGGNAGVDVCRRIALKYVCACLHDKALGQSCTRDDGL